MKQRGFSTTLIAGAVALLVIGGLLVVQTKRLETAKVELSDCKTKYKQALASIQHQNEAVEALARAGAQATARSEVALKAANASLRASQSERDRLKGLAKKPATGLCPAGQAVSEVRQGLAK